ncbi:hypothetical protein MPH_00185 [Macrophomina phaseolina MS6]|uniref:Uncharacterized protein n=1 Tax=Macrophomina phaseolina (strain MS6) TaxID=1126212 RepID=K2T0N1_MACPH|nr:hypothetical protein MPH_00185 [Macrophomina phaseolina MS6]
MTLSPRLLAYRDALVCESSTSSFRSAVSLPTHVGYAVHLSCLSPSPCSRTAGQPTCQCTRTAKTYTSDIQLPPQESRFPILARSLGPQKLCQTLYLRIWSCCGSPPLTMLVCVKHCKSFRNHW